MLDVNMVIANNIQNLLKKENRNQSELALAIGVSRQTMSKIINGTRAINAIELSKIAKYLHLPMEQLVMIPKAPVDTNVLHDLKNRVKSTEAKRGIDIADVLSSLILFHTKVYENGKKMDEPWDDDHLEEANYD